MELIYQNKEKAESILSRPVTISFDKPWNDNTNKLILGDNTDVLLYMLNNGFNKKIDLIYIDPPFATNNTFTFDKSRANAISRKKNAEVAYADTLDGEEYLEFLRQRLILARELMSDVGSIYLHIDCKVGHYVKLIMDEVFGISNFRNDITRVKCNPKNFERKAYGNTKDLILFYSKGKNCIWNNPLTDYTEEQKARLFPKMDEHGRRYTTIPLHAPGETENGETSKPFCGILPPKGRHWRSSPAELEKLNEQGLIEWSKNGNPRRKIYADERQGCKTQDIWEYKDPQYPAYPTEKNAGLLDFIVRASSNQDSVVMDFFCGSGTALASAERLGRRWIGIDSSETAIKIAKEKLENASSLLYSSFDVLRAVQHPLQQASERLEQKVAAVSAP